MSLWDKLIGVSKAGGEEKVPVAPMQTFGVNGTVEYGGYLQDPEKDKRIQGHMKYKTYSDILANTSIVGAGTRYFLNLVAKARWRVEPADDSPQAKEYAEKVESIMDGMTTPFHRVVRRAAMYRFYGYSVQEWTAKKCKEGHIGFLDVESRPQHSIERWNIDNHGRVLGMHQRRPQDQVEVYLPREKTIYIVDDSLADRPDGLGLFRHLVSPVFRLREYERLEGVGYDTDLHGVPVGRAPYSTLQEKVRNNEMTTEEAEKAIRPIKDFINSHIKNAKLGIIIDSEVYKSQDEGLTPSAQRKWDIDVLRVGLGGTLQQAASAIDRVNREIARILGCEHLLLGENDRGSFSMSQDKSQNFYLIVDSALQEIQQGYQWYIDVLWLLNGWPDDKKPKFRPESLKFHDVQQITAALRDLAIAGSPVALNDPAINDIREILGISSAPEVEFSDGYLNDEGIVREEGAKPGTTTGQNSGKKPGDDKKPSDEEVKDQAKKAFAVFHDIMQRGKK